MQRYKCIIVEDEPLATGILKSYISRVPYLDLLGEFREAISAGSQIQKQEIDLLFLDIHLPEIKGFEFLRTLTKTPAVIVTTAYHQYAIEGFELSVTDYLLKPFSFDRFLTAVNKAVKQREVEHVMASRPEELEMSLFLTIDRRKVKILFEEIDYIESSREYVKIFTKKTKYISKISTCELERMLPTDRFKRIHRSFIVALDKVEAYNKEYIEIKGKRIPIGGRFKKEILYLNKK